jgi:hypothetical protein
LKDSAKAYLDHLESADLERLTHSCLRARKMVRQCESGQDPKPWFYAGLFSLATGVEAERFLGGHWFTAACIPGLPETWKTGMAPDEVGPETEAKLECIRAGLAKLDCTD